MLQPLAAVMPQSRHQSGGYWGLQSLCRSLCTTAHWQHACMLQSLKECPSPVTNQGTIGACSPCVARRSCASTAGALCLHNGGLVPPQRRSCVSTAEVLCLHRGGLVPPPRRSCASTTEVLCLHRGVWLLHHLCSAVILQPLAAVMPQSRHQGRGYWGLQSLCCSLCTTAHWQHVRMLQSLQECPSPVTNQGTIGACSPCVAA